MRSLCDQDKNDDNIFQYLLGFSYHDQDNRNDEIYVHISAAINPTTMTTLMMRCVQISAMISPTVTTTTKMVRRMFRHRLGYFLP